MTSSHTFEGGTNGGNPNPGWWKEIKFKKKKNARSFEHAIVLEDTWWGVLRPSRWGAPPAVLLVRPLDARFFLLTCALLNDVIAHLRRRRRLPETAPSV